MSFKTPILAEANTTRDQPQNLIDMHKQAPHETHPLQQLHRRPWPAQLKGHIDYDDKSNQEYNADKENQTRNLRTSDTRLHAAPTKSKQPPGGSAWTQDPHLHAPRLRQTAWRQTPATRVAQHQLTKPQTTQAEAGDYNAQNQPNKEHKPTH